MNTNISDPSGLLNLNSTQLFLPFSEGRDLYPVIPNDCKLQALVYFLDKRNIEEPSKSTLTRLAELVLTLNLFSFNNEYYRELGGVAVGSRMGPNYACYHLIRIYAK